MTIGDVGSNNDISLPSYFSTIALKVACILQNICIFDWSLKVNQTVAMSQKAKFSFCFMNLSTLTGPLCICQTLIL